MGDLMGVLMGDLMRVLMGLMGDMGLMGKL